MFGPQQIITQAIEGAWAVHAEDLDGDGDADVLSASNLDDTIAWYENLGGGTFSGPQVITQAADGAFSVHARDLDGDGDADVLSASLFDDTIAWYENLGGGASGALQVITQAADGARAVYAEDLDGDGDADVLSASWYDDAIAWYENQGGGVFGGRRVISQLADVASSVYATDLDGDGDADVLSASGDDSTVAWYQNLLGSSCAGSYVYCVGGTNSLGASAKIGWSGSTSHAENALNLEVSDAYPQQLGIFIMGPQQAQNPFGDGFLCISGSVSRLLPPVVLDTDGAGTFVVDTSDGSSSASAIQPGSAWNFQFWYRDPDSTGALFNLSDGAHIEFCP